MILKDNLFLIILLEQNKQMDYDRLVSFYENYYKLQITKSIIDTCIKNISKSKNILDKEIYNIIIEHISKNQIIKEENIETQLEKNREQYFSKSWIELKQILKDRNLEINGKKDILIQRLILDDITKK